MSPAALAPRLLLLLALPLCAAAAALAPMADPAARRPPPLSPARVRAALADSAVEAAQFCGAACPRIPPPSALVFLRDFVAPNRPCVIQGAISHWPARSLWTDEYLCEKFGDHKIKINATPNGRGDAVVDGEFFVLPEEREMTFSEFLTEIRRGEDVLYLSHQDDNFRKQLQGILGGDVDASITFADEALGLEPDAVNLWFGDSRSVTSLHKDHYQNMYAVDHYQNMCAVVRGKKHFTLYPPTSLPLLYPRKFKPRQYEKKDGTWTMRSATGDNAEVFGGGEEKSHQWISADPLNPDYAAHPLFQQAVPIQVSVGPGELLYLPAMWYHQVAQDDDTLAVNYWYDMDYSDGKFVHHSLINTLLDLCEDAELGQ